MHGTGTIRYELSETHARLLEAKRKIPCDIAVAMGLVSYGKDCIAFEYRRNGVCEYRKVMTVSYNRDGTREKSFYIEPKNASLFAWNVDCLSAWSRPQDVLCITEGELDACSLAAAGEVFVISVPNGANRDKVGEGTIDPLNDGGFAWLWDGPRLLPLINAFEKIVLVVDNDHKGTILREELAVRLGKQRCWGVTYPPDCKDANDVLVKHGDQALQDVVLTAMPLVPNKLVSFRDLPQAQKIVEYSAWDNDLMTKHLRINIPELMVICGAPGAGKSTWALNLCARLAEFHHMKGAILQFEDQPRRNFDDLVRFKLRENRDASLKQRELAEKWVDQMFTTIAPVELTEGADADYTFKWLRDAIWEAVKRHGALWVLIDPWNEIEHVWSVNESETRYTNEALRQLKRMARQYNILIIVVVHPTKAAGQKSDIEDMSIYDASGSNAWKNKADHGVVIFRPDENVTTLVKIDKCKNHRTMGIPGIVEMIYEPDISDFGVVGKYVARTG